MADPIQEYDDELDQAFSDAAWPLLEEHLDGDGADGGPGAGARPRPNGTMPSRHRGPAHAHAAATTMTPRHHGGSGGAQAAAAALTPSYEPMPMSTQVVDDLEDFNMNDLHADPTLFDDFDLDDVVGPAVLSPPQSGMPASAAPPAPAEGRGDVRPRSAAGTPAASWTAAIHGGASASNAVASPSAPRQQSPLRPTRVLSKSTSMASSAASSPSHAGSRAPGPLAAAVAAAHMTALQPPLDATTASATAMSSAAGDAHPAGGLEDPMSGATGDARGWERTLQQQQRLIEQLKQQHQAMAQEAAKLRDAKYAAVGEIAFLRDKLESTRRDAERAQMRATQIEEVARQQQGSIAQTYEMDLRRLEAELAFRKQEVVEIAAHVQGIQRSGPSQAPWAASQAASPTASPAASPQRSQRPVTARRTPGSAEKTAFLGPAALLPPRRATTPLAVPPSQLHAATTTTRGHWSSPARNDDLGDGLDDGSAMAVDTAAAGPSDDDHDGALTDHSVWSFSDAETDIDDADGPHGVEHAGDAVAAEAQRRASEALHQIHHNVQVTLDGQRLTHVAVANAARPPPPPSVSTAAPRLVGDAVDAWERHLNALAYRPRFQITDLLFPQTLELWERLQQAIAPFIVDTDLSPPHAPSTTRLVRLLRTLHLPLDCLAAVMDRAGVATVRAFVEGMTAVSRDSEVARRPGDAAAASAGGIDATMPAPPLPGLPHDLQSRDPPQTSPVAQQARHAAWRRMAVCFRWTWDLCTRPHVAKQTPTPLLALCFSVWMNWQTRLGPSLPPMPLAPAVSVTPSAATASLRRIESMAMGLSLRDTPALAVWHGMGGLAGMTVWPVVLAPQQPYANHLAAVRFLQRFVRPWTAPRGPRAFFWDYALEQSLLERLVRFLLPAVAERRIAQATGAAAARCAQIDLDLALVTLFQSLVHPRPAADVGALTASAAAGATATGRPDPSRNDSAAAASPIAAQDPEPPVVFGHAPACHRMRQTHIVERLGDRLHRAYLACPRGHAHAASARPSVLVAPAATWPGCTPARRPATTPAAGCGASHAQEAAAVAAGTPFPQAPMATTALPSPRDADEDAAAMRYVGLQSTTLVAQLVSLLHDLLVVPQVHQHALQRWKGEKSRSYHLTALTLHRLVTDPDHAAWGVPLLCRARALLAAMAPPPVDETGDALGGDVPANTGTPAATTERTAPG